MAYLGRSLRRKGVRERPAVRAALALALSLVLNALAGWLVALAGAFDVPKPVVSAPVALAPLGAADWEANRAVRGERAPPEPRERAAGPVIELPESDAPPPEEAPRDARHSAERNHAVDRETVSRHAGNYPELAAKPEIAAPGRPAAAARRDADAEKEGREGEPGERGEASAAKPGEEGERGDRLALAPAPFGERGSGEGGEGGRRARGKLAPDLSLGTGAAARALAGPNMDGYGEGLEEGDVTALNASAFKFATFFNRMKSEIGHEWIPRVRAASQARDPDASMFFYKDRTVALGITLDSDGRVKDLDVLETSNVDFFDRVALDSVQAAQPFPNPPRGLLGGDGEARFAFTFTLYAGDSRPRLRWLRVGER